MSGGQSSSKNTSQQTATQSLDPQIKSALLGNLEQTKALAGQEFTPFGGPRVASFADGNLQAQSRATSAANSNYGGNILQEAIAAAQAGTGYTPGTVSANINRGDIRDVGYSDTTGTDIARLMNPYEDTVVANSLADIDRQRQLAQTDNSAMATKLGAFRGTGMFNARDRTDDTYARTSASTAGQLRYDGFNTAISGAQADAARKAQADATNQGVDASVASQNANLGIQAQTANNQFGQEAARLNQSGAQLLGGLSDQTRRQENENIGLLNSVGDAQRNMSQAQIDAAYEEYLRSGQWPVEMQKLTNESLGLLGNPTLSDSQGTSSGSSKSANFDTGLSFGFKF